MGQQWMRSCADRPRVARRAGGCFAVAAALLLLGFLAPSLSHTRDMATFITPAPTLFAAGTPEISVRPSGLQEGGIGRDSYPSRERGTKGAAASSGVEDLQIRYCAQLRRCCVCLKCS